MVENKNKQESTDFVYRLTTTDNDFDPFDDFERWFARDMALGYNSCNYVASLAGRQLDMSDPVDRKINNDIIDEIIALNLSGNYTKVVREC